MPEYIKTAGQLRRVISQLNDNAPIQFSLNGVATNVYLLGSGVEGDEATIIVEPNYTCKPAA
jgi:hypothetical protein